MKRNILGKFYFLVLSVVILQTTQKNSFAFERSESVIDKRDISFVETFEIGAEDIIKGLQSEYVLNHEHVREYKLRLKHTLFSDLGVKRKSRHHKRKNQIIRYPKLKAHLECDAPFDLIRKPLQSDIKNVRKIDFNWGDSRLGAPKFYLRPSKAAKHCVLTYKGKYKKKTYQGQSKLVAESIQYPKLSKNILHSKESCTLQASDDPRKSFFLTRDFKRNSCPTESADINMLPNGFDGIRAKVNLLLGYDLSDFEIAAHDPTMDLDFSQLPKLDVIVLSALVFRADFYGNIIVRLLREHAKRGALIRVMISKVITLDKDFALLNSLSHQYSNVKIQYYKWPFKNGSGKGSIIDPFHRTMHMKFFVTFSVDEPYNNRIVLGGRNIHDGFVYKERPDASAFPDLVQYGDDENWAVWRDFELEISSTVLSKQLIQHFFMFWYRDYRSLKSDLVNFQIPSDRSTTQLNKNSSVIRHMVSIPFKDNKRLTDYYVNLIESAQRKLVISTPYFRLNKHLSRAIKDAVDRGVEITLITRINLKGDTLDWLASDVNKAGINALYENINIFEYTVPKEILHSKLVLVDDEMSFISSVNLNQRSFIHDVESGLLIWNAKLNADLQDLLAEYQSLSVEIDEKQKIAFFSKILMSLLNDKF